jgi:hypothetical protein
MLIPQSTNFSCIFWNAEAGGEARQPCIPENKRGKAVSTRPSILKLAFPYRECHEQ